MYSLRSFILVGEMFFNLFFEGKLWLNNKISNKKLI